MKKKTNNGVKFYVVISFVAVLAIASVAMAYSAIQNITVQGDYVYNEAPGQDNGENFGAVSGPDHYERQNFHNSIVVGGNVVSTSSNIAAITMSGTELNEDVRTFLWTANLNTTITLPRDITANGLLGLQEVGDSRTILIKNASSTAASTITIAAGAGMDLQYDEDSADLAILGLDWAELTFLRTNSTGSTTVFMTEFTEAD